MSISMCRGPAASIALLNKAIAAARAKGSTREYFGGRASEAPMRCRFAAVAALHSKRKPEARARARDLLKELNREYSTRASLAQLPRLADLMVEEVHKRGWWKQGAPGLLDASDEVAEQIGAFVPNVLNLAAQAGGQRHYSLVTKFLHFCLPETFAIYDSNAARSIEMWSLFAHHGNDAEIRRFAFEPVSVTTGTGYRHLLRFYRTVWNAAGSKHRAARRAAADLEVFLGRKRGAAGPCVSVLDLLDKLMWDAAGNPIKLGLA